MKILLVDNYYLRSGSEDTIFQLDISLSHYSWRIASIVQLLIVSEILVLEFCQAIDYVMKVTV